MDKLYQTNSEDEMSQASSLKSSRKGVSYLITVQYCTHTFISCVVVEATSLKPSLDVFSKFVKDLSTKNYAIKRDDAGMAIACSDIVTL